VVTSFPSSHKGIVDDSSNFDMIKGVE
jgi:hypothetical protein